MTKYKTFQEAKNGTKIPLFLSGRSMESRYNPERDAENLCSSIEEAFSFFLVLGIGSGLFIKQLSEKFPAAKIIGLELSQDDLDFLYQSEILQALSKNPLIKFTDLSNLEETLIQNYLPARYGDLKIIEQKAWVNENQNQIEKINTILKRSLGIISADYSVQAHFGKIWTCNILNNCKLAESTALYSLKKIQSQAQNKTAVIVAAGPSLDKTISIINNAESRNDYYIFSTDTAAQALIKHGIIPEVIVSIDGQAVSYNHFINLQKLNHKLSAKPPLFAFDLSANSSAVRYIINSACDVSFFCSGHPLSTAINASNSYAFCEVFSGAGTVTISALDLAIKSGFKKLIILGADFSYSNGKAYACGTYLDTLYNKNSSKLIKAEQTFTRLMFRTELKSLSDTVKTTDILQAYRSSLEKYLSDKKIDYKKENDIYKLECRDNIRTELSESKTFSLKPFFERLKNSSQEEKECILLPYIAWLRNNLRYKKASYNELVNLALESIVSYNI